MKPRLVICDRRDLLGGRLSALLNAQRIARKIGGKLVFVWYRDETPFQKLVADVEEIFEESFLHAYDASSSLGFRIPSDWSQTIRASKTRRGLPCLEGDKFETGEYLVEPIFDEDPNVGYLVDTNFSLFSLDGEDEIAIREELSQEFRALPIRPQLRAAFQEIDAAVENWKPVISVHLRRMHLYQETIYTLNRFKSYVATPIALATIGRLLTPFRTVLLASDNEFFVSKCRRMFGNRVRTLSDALDLRPFTGIQRALLDIYFLSRGERVLGAMSAFSFCSSLCQGVALEHILDTAARLGIDAHDPTGCLAYRRTKLDGFLERAVPSQFGLNGDRPGLLLSLGRHHAIRETAVELMIEATALEFTQYVHRIFGGDFQHYTSSVIDTAFRLGISSLAEWFQSLQTMLPQRSSSSLIIDLVASVPASREISEKGHALCVVIACAAAADVLFENKQWHEAAEYYIKAESSAPPSWLPMRGIRIRLAAAYQVLSDVTNEIITLRRAVEADPQFAYSSLELGFALERQGNFPEADAAFQSAVWSDDEIGSIWAARGDLAMKQKRYNEAREFFVNAVQCEPENQRYIVLLSSVPTRESILSGSDIPFDNPDIPVGKPQATVRG